MAHDEAKREELADVPPTAYRRRNWLTRGRLWLPVVAVLLAVVFWGWEYFLRGAERYTPAPLASVHATWDGNCAACHASSWPIGGNNWLVALTATTHVADARCQSCHAGPPHRANQLAHEVEGCTSCHRDHHGRQADLTRVADALCTRCHADLSNHVAAGTQSALRDVTRFDAAGHPEFRAVREANDPGNIAFNHRLHLTPGLRGRADTNFPFTLADLPAAERERYRQPGQRGDQAPVQLDCSACHRTGADGRHMLPISYEQHCRACHPLTVDRQVEGDPATGTFTVRHGLQPEEIHDVLRGYYTEKFLQGALPAGQGTKRPLPGKGLLRADAKEAAERRIARAIRADERVLFGPSTCQKCHETDARNQAAWGVPRRIPPATVPPVWFPHAKFDHAAHRALNCQECHAQADTATTKDAVLLPGVAKCLECHAPPQHAGDARRGGARFDCVECHRYHEVDRPPHGKGSAARQPARRVGLEQFLRGPGE